MTEERAKKVLQEQIDRYGQEYDAEGIEALEMAIKALEQTGWILTSEKLPKKNGVYIASYEDAITLLYWFNGKWFFHPSNPAREETGTIIAWQPLPQPYRAEMEGEE